MAPEPAIEAQLAGVNRIPLPRRRINWKFERTRTAMINAYANLLFDNYDCVIMSDVDEIIFADPAKGDLRSLIEAARGHPVVNVIGLQVVERRDDPEISPQGARLFAARPIAFVDADCCKPRIAFDSPGWSRGGHASRHPLHLGEGLFMAHLKCASSANARQVAEARAELVEGFDGIGNEARQRWWTKGDRMCRWMSKAASSRPLVDLDDQLDLIRAELAANVGENRAQRAGFSYALPGLNLSEAYRMPERFAGLDITLWA
ncbi:MAG TPA: hypothetical protein PK450_10650 [Paracoccaceae bacterium]|nr:hypothetical protein [Paracoccaceae bacterium]